MKFYFILLSFLLILPQVGVSQEVERDIHKLIQNRQELFSQYADQIKKRSGIFGSQSKRDIKKSADILHSIIEKDNEIIREMERMLEKRQMQYLDEGVDRENAQQKNRKIISIIDRLKLENDEMMEENRKLRMAKKFSNFYTIVASAVAAVLLFIILRRKYGGEKS